jgi:hypothetical protein
MATGWNAGGYESRFSCGGGVDGLFVPNCFSGTNVHADYTPGNTFGEVAVDNNDVSIEFWFKMILFEDWDVGSPPFAYVGFMGNGGGLFPGYRIGAEITEGRIQLRIDDGVDLALGAIETLSPGWHHILVEMVRGATDLAKLYIDGVEVDSVDISTITLSLATCIFVPYATTYEDTNLFPDLGIDGDPGTDYPDSLTDTFTDYDFYHHPGIVGPVAAHLATLTEAQIQDSLLRRDVQDLASTAVLYRWTEVQGVESWETNPRHIIRGYSDYVRRVGAPVGEQGAIIVPDQSGNGVDLTLESFTEYGQIPWDFVGAEAKTAGMRSHVAFASDSFFQTGGGVPGGTS